jgi:hypothetical protein
MNYTVITQFTPGDNSLYVSQLVRGVESWTYTSETEAQTKLDELIAADSSGRVYKIISYPEDPNPIPL